MGVKRYALVHGDGRAIAAYLPANYQIVAYVPQNPRSDEDFIRIGQSVVIEGQDMAGWTLDDYVIPRLASGLYAAREIDLSHGVFKEIPESPRDHEGYLLFTYAGDWRLAKDQDVLVTDAHVHAVRKVRSQIEEIAEKDPGVLLVSFTDGAYITVDREGTVSR